MQKNVAGQKIGAQMVSATNGSAFTSTVTVYVTGNAGTQAIGTVGSGVCTHEGNGYHTYAPSQAETNFELVAFTFIGTGAVPATIQVFTTNIAGPTAQYPVAEEFTVVVPARRSTNLVASQTYYVQPTEKVLMAVDFTNILHEGDAISEITSVTEDTSQPITLTEVGVMGSQAKFWVEDVVADTTYRIECKVLTLFGLTLEGDFSLAAAD